MEKGIMCNKTDKGYGFIRSSTGERIFVHIKNVDPEVYVRLAKGSKVLFDYEETYKGKSASCKTSTSGPLPERNTACSSSAIFCLSTAILRPARVFPAPGTPVIKQIDFLLLALL